MYLTLTKCSTNIGYIIDRLNALIQQFDNKTNSEKLILLNKELGKIVYDLKCPKPVNETFKKKELEQIFRISWNNKDIVSSKYFNFTEDEVINFISSFNGGTKVLSLPKKTHEFQSIDMTNVPFKLQSYDIKHLLSNRTSKNYDAYGLSYDSLFKILDYIPYQSSIGNTFTLKLICDFYMNLITDASFCDEWKCPKLYLSYKGGDPSLIKRYRPLIILPTLVKAMEYFITEQIMRYVVENNKIAPTIQKAHLRGISGSWEHAFHTNAQLHKYQNKKSHNVTFFLDIKDAFGSVNYKVLIKILELQKYPQWFVLYVKKYYTNLHVLYGSKKIRWKKGLLQGSSLSNLLFLIYLDFVIKELITFWEKAKLIPNKGIFLTRNLIFAFVDDIKITFLKDWKIQEMLTIMELIFNDYGFNFNFTKTYYLEFRGKELDFWMDSEKIRRVPDNFHYLGQPLITSPNFKNFIKDSLKNILQKIDALNITTKMKTYLYYVMTFHKMNRFYQIFIPLLGKEIYEKISVIDWYYLQKWEVKIYNGSPVNLFDFTVERLKIILTKSVYNLNKSYNLIGYIKSLKLSLDYPEYLKSYFGITTFATWSPDIYSHICMRFLSHKLTASEMTKEIASAQEHFDDDDVIVKNMSYQNNDEDFVSSFQ